MQTQGQKNKTHSQINTNTGKEIQIHRPRKRNTQAMKYKNTGKKKQGQTSFAVSSSQPMARSTEIPNCTKSR